MEGWKDVCLVVLLLGMLIFGDFLMARLDKFLDENRKAIGNEAEKKAPSCIMLTDEFSDEEIAQEIRRFRETHDGTRIILYDSSDTGLSESVECYTEQKRQVIDGDL